jgi:uncharacterized protein with von Willebrand factor type A (vWA) domain
MDAATLDRPYDRLGALPRGLWLPGLVTACGDCAQRLADAARWLEHLKAGQLPPAEADFADADAVRPLREAIAELGLPVLTRGTPALAEQVLRTALWHLDRIPGLQPKCTRDEAIAHAAAGFRDEWQLETAGLEEDLALLQGLGDLAALRWDELRGQLRSREWQAARRASEWLLQLPSLAELIRRLGRAERAPTRRPQAPPPADGRTARRTAMRAVTTTLPDEPGEITGVRLSGRIERMVPAEAAMLRHPVLKKLWRARHAESRLLTWRSEAVLVDWRADPRARPRPASPLPDPEPLERGPVILCLDTSGSMRGAPENIAKAVAIAALRLAHESGRACRLLAYGGPGELVECDLDLARGGLAPLLELMGRSFDGGTDVQTPIERAIDSVHEAGWSGADVLIVSDGEFGCMPRTLDRLEAARERLGLRVQGVLVGDRETMGLLEVCDDIHWVRDWRRYADAAQGGDGRGFSPVHSRSLTALYFPNALSRHAQRHRPEGAG